MPLGYNDVNKKVGHPTSITEEGSLISEAEYDRDGYERLSLYSKGAFEYDLLGILDQVDLHKNEWQVKPYGEYVCVVSKGINYPTVDIHPRG